MPEGRSDQIPFFRQEQVNSIRGHLYQLFRTQTPFGEKKRIEQVVEGNTQVLRYFLTEEGRRGVELTKEKQKGFLGKLKKQAPELTVQITEAEGTDSLIFVERKQLDKTVKKDAYVLDSGERFAFERADKMPISGNEIASLRGYIKTMVDMTPVV